MVLVGVGVRVGAGGDATVGVEVGVRVGVGEGVGVLDGVAVEVGLIVTSVSFVEDDMGNTVAIVGKGVSVGFGFGGSQLRPIMKLFIRIMRRTMTTRIHAATLTIFHFPDATSASCVVCG